MVSVTQSGISGTRPAGNCSERALGGGKVYDALLIECARHSQADRIYTFNLGDFRRLAPDLAERMVAP